MHATWESKRLPLGFVCALLAQQSITILERKLPPSHRVQYICLYGNEALSTNPGLHFTNTFLLSQEISKSIWSQICWLYSLVRLRMLNIFYPQVSENCRDSWKWLISNEWHTKSRVTAYIEIFFFKNTEMCVWTITWIQAILSFAFNGVRHFFLYIPSVLNALPLLNMPQKRKNSVLFLFSSIVIRGLCVSLSLCLSFSLAPCKYVCVCVCAKGRVIV